MRLSIRLRMILAMNVLVVGLALVLGRTAQNVAAELVEERYAAKMVASASEFLQERRYPPSDSVMGYFRELFAAESLTSQDEGRDIIGSSLPRDLSEQCLAQVRSRGRSGVLELGGTRYRYHSVEVAVVNPRTTHETDAQLHMLFPDAQFAEARRLVRGRVAGVVWPAALVATLLAVLMSVSITRPIRRVAVTMDRLKDTGATELDDPADRAPDCPAEVASLENSFRRLMRRLHDTHEQLVLSDRLATLGKLSLSVAHELRNPLSGIRMNLQVLKDHEDLAEDPGIDAMLREIDRMSLYLDELMGLARGGDAQGEKARVRVHLSELIQSVLTILEGRIRHAGLKVRTSFDPAEPDVLANPNHLRQAAMNLLVNAIEASPPSGTITVNVQCLGEEVRLSIADTGVGVTAGNRDIFAAFTTTKPNGGGMGLYTCKRIVEEHGGSIGYENGSTGTTFWISLPLRDARTGGEPSEYGEPGGKGR